MKNRPLQVKGMIFLDFRVYYDYIEMYSYMLFDIMNILFLRHQQRQLICLCHFLMKTSVSYSLEFKLSKILFNVTYQNNIFSRICGKFILCHENPRFIRMEILLFDTRIQTHDFPICPVCISRNTISVSQILRQNLSRSHENALRNRLHGVLCTL